MNTTSKITAALVATAVILGSATYGYIQHKSSTYWTRDPVLCLVSGISEDQAYMGLIRTVRSNGELAAVFSLNLSSTTPPRMTSRGLELRSSGHRFTLLPTEIRNLGSQTLINIDTPERLVELVDVLVADGPIELGPRGGTLAVVSFERHNLNEILQDIFTCFE